MPDEKANCWEYMACGLGPGGARSAELGVCPAATESRFEGINHGHAAGRFCWAINGTLCRTGHPISNSEKFFDCVNCSFYRLVQEREEAGFVVIERQLGKPPF